MMTTRRVNIRMKWRMKMRIKMGIERIMKLVMKMRMKIRMKWGMTLIAMITKTDEGGTGGEDATHDGDNIVHGFTSD